MVGGAGCHGHHALGLVSQVRVDFIFKAARLVPIEQPVASEMRTSACMAVRL